MSEAKNDSLGAAAVFLVLTLPRGPWRRLGTVGLVVLLAAVLAMPVVRSRVAERVKVPFFVKYESQADKKDEKEDNPYDPERPVFERDATAWPRVLMRALSATSRRGPRRRYAQEEERR